MTEKRAHRLVKRLDSMTLIFKNIISVAVCLVFLSIVIGLLASFSGIFSSEIGEKIFTSSMTFGCGMILLLLLIFLLRAILCGGFYLERLVSREESVAVLLNRQNPLSRERQTLHIFLDDFPESCHLDRFTREVICVVELDRNVTFTPSYCLATYSGSMAEVVAIRARYDFIDLRQALQNMISAQSFELNEMTTEAWEKAYDQWDSLSLWSETFPKISDFIAALQLAVKEKLIPNTPEHLVFRGYSWNYTNVECDDD